jgi:hypothetical protein
MTTTTPEKRDLRIWQIRDILSRITPEDMTDAELEAAIAIFLRNQEKRRCRYDYWTAGVHTLGATRQSGRSSPAAIMDSVFLVLMVAAVLV